MKYTVLWAKVAEDRLAELWMDAPDRQAVADASNTIDRLLANDPDQQGESREEDTRVLVVAPLGVLFDINPGDRIVNVLSVWAFDTHDPGA